MTPIGLPAGYLKLIIDDPETRVRLDHVQTEEDCVFIRIELKYNPFSNHMLNVERHEVDLGMLAARIARAVLEGNGWKLLAQTLKNTFTGEIFNVVSQGSKGLLTFSIMMRKSFKPVKPRPSLLDAIIDQAVRQVV